MLILDQIPITGHRPARDEVPDRLLPIVAQDLVDRAITLGMSAHTVDGTGGH